MIAESRDQLRLEYDLSRQDLLQAGLYLRRQSPVNGWFRTHFNLLLVACGVLFADVLWGLKNGRWPVVEGCVILLILWLVLNLSWRAYRLPAKGYELLVGPQRLIADDSGISMLHLHGSIHCHWTAFCNLCETGEYVLLLRSPEHGLTIPKNACKPEQLARLLQLCRQHIGSTSCPQCGYNLTGNVSGKCPECGQIITNR
jgi:hypothetical protein